MSDYSRVVLGVHPGHDATACLAMDGNAVAAVAEERLSRRKLHLGFPWRSIPQVLELAGMDASEIEVVAFSFRSYLSAPPFLTRALLNRSGCSIPLDGAFGVRDVILEQMRQIRGGSGVSIAYPRISKRFSAHTRNLYRKALISLGLREDVKLVPVDHHLSHAASAFFTSGFDECLVITADGAGDNLSSTWNHAKGDRIKRVAQCSGTVSLGKFYSAITCYLGFEPHRHEGKVTGLAAYGDPGVCRELLAPCISYDPLSDSFATELRLKGAATSMARMSRFLRGRYYRDAYFDAVLCHCQRYLSKYTREDLAAAAQRILEEQMIQYVRAATRCIHSSNLALAGGVFANVRLNNLIAELPEVERIFVHPNMGDGGTALGAALAVSDRYAKPSRESRQFRFDPFLGPDFDDSRIESALKQAGIDYRHCANIENEMACLVASGSIVGRFAGRMEYGPRALGNRSILALPRLKDIHKLLNERLNRSEFMPFAPAILESRASQYLDGIEARRSASRYMTLCFHVTPDREDDFHGACHIDGTARAQLVDAHSNPSFHKFLTHLESESGLPFVLNTSFNSHGAPIVCNPEDAIGELMRGAVDVLAIGPFLTSSVQSPGST